MRSFVTALFLLNVPIYHASNLRISIKDLADTNKSDQSGSPNLKKNTEVCLTNVAGDGTIAGTVIISDKNLQFVVYNETAILEEGRTACLMSTTKPYLYISASSRSYSWTGDVCDDNGLCFEENFIASGKSFSTYCAYPGGVSEVEPYPFCPGPGSKLN